jgi:transposase
MAIADRHGFPVAICTASASPHEIAPVQELLNAFFLDELPPRLIGDKRYDSDKLDAQLEQNYGIELIAPNKSNRLVITQDGRKLRRYRRRWKVERLFVWLQQFRRITTRHDRFIENYIDFLHLGCILILLRCF